jgi:hypothetical protein
MTLHAVLKKRVVKSGRKWRIGFAMIAFTTEHQAYSGYMVV